MKKVWGYIVAFVKWWFRRKRLYRIAGAAAVVFLFWELGAANIPPDYLPDPEVIGQKYGELAKTVSGYLIDKYASGTNYLNVSIAGGLLLICLLIEFNILKPQKIVNATNVFSGWFQIINQTNHYDKD